MSDTPEPPVVLEDKYLGALQELSNRADTLGETVEARDEVRRRDITTMTRFTKVLLVVAVLSMILSALSLRGNILIHETQHTNGTILTDLEQVFDPHSQLNQSGAQKTNAIELSVELCDANAYLRISESQHDKTVEATHVGVIENIAPTAPGCAVSPLP